MSITLDGSNLTTVGVINSATAQASTSGTSIDFTGIPSGTKRITVMFNGVSTNGTSKYQIQVGSGSVVTTGYSSSASYVTTSVGNSTATTGFIITAVIAAIYLNNGSVVLALIGSNTWTSTSILSYAGDNIVQVASGISPALSGALDRIRITTVNGTDTFDAGSINILYE